MTPGIVSAAVSAATEGGSATDPVFTHAVGWSKTSAGVWTGIVMALIYLLPKFITAMRKLSYDRGDQLDDERRTDMASMRIEIAEIKAEVRAERERANEAERIGRETSGRLATAIFAIELLSARVRKEWPDDDVLLKVQEYLLLAKAG